MKLFIIGNGFDIGHGLPIKYWDFRTFLDLVHPEFLKSFEEHYDIYPGMSDEAKKKHYGVVLKATLPILMKIP